MTAVRQQSDQAVSREAPVSNQAELDRTCKQTRLQACENEQPRPQLRRVRRRQTAEVLQEVRDRQTHHGRPVQERSRQPAAASRYEAVRFGRRLVADRRGTYN